MLTALLITLTVTFMLRLVPGVLWPSAGSDMGYHLLLQRELRRHHLRMPARIMPLALDEQQVYPWFFHILLACLPEKWLLKYPSLPSALIDTLHAGLVFGVAVYLAAEASLPISGPALGMLAGLLFATSPALLSLGIGPRSYEITPRPLAELLFTFAMVAAGFYLVRQQPWFLAAASLGCALIYLSSLFGVQVMLFCFPVMAVVSGQWALLALPCLGFLVALLVTRGRYWTTLRGQLHHLSMYRVRFQYEHPKTKDRNDWGHLRQVFQQWCQGRFKDQALLKDLILSIDNNSYLQFLIRHNLWFLVILLMAFQIFPPGSGQLGLWREYLWAWMLAPIAPFILTSLKHWRFLGEAERYLEFALAPACLLGSLGVQTLPASWFSVIAAFYGSLTFLLLAMVWVRKKVTTRYQQDEVTSLHQLIAFLMTIPAGANTLVIPANLSYELAYHTSIRALATLDFFVWKRDFDRIFYKYPLPSPDLNRWRRLYAMEYLVVWKRYAESYGCGQIYDLSQVRPVFENRTYAVYQA